MKLHLRHAAGKLRHACGLRQRAKGERYLELWVDEEGMAHLPEFWSGRVATISIDHVHHLVWGGEPVEPCGECLGILRERKAS